jgi:hypothetical protein
MRLPRHLPLPLSLIAFLPGAALAQARQSTGEVGMYAEVLPVPVMVNATTTAIVPQSAAAVTRWESRVRLESKHRIAIEVDGRRSNDANGATTLDVTAEQDGTVTRRYDETRGTASGASGFTRQVTVRFRAKPGVSAASTVVQVRILVGFDGAT